MSEQRNRAIVLGTDRVILRVVKPPTTAELLDEWCRERGDWSTEADYDPLAPKRAPQHAAFKNARDTRRGRS